MTEEAEIRSLANALAGGDGGSRFADSLRFCLDHENAIQRQRERLRRELPSGVNPHNLAQTGWGVIVAHEEKSRKVMDRLSPLITMRREQAGTLFKEEPDPGVSGSEFLCGKHGEAPGTINPKVLPYYILIIGSPEQIPFEFQYDLAVNRAVGRLYFDDLDDYSRYAEAVVAAEQPDHILRPKKIGIFSVTTDETTRVLRQFLVEPLTQGIRKRVPEWSVEPRQNDKDSLKALLGAGEERPEVLLVACHGRRLAFGDPDQEAKQGALACADGLSFDASDLKALDPAERPLQGLIAGLFACYSAGTPAVDNFPKGGMMGQEIGKPRMIAETEFVGRLPRALLARGALAVLGHADRGWTSSFRWLHREKVTTATHSLEDSIVRLLEGHRLGHALRPIYRRYSNIAAHLLPLVEAWAHKRDLDDKEIFHHWIAFRDARNYIVLGDPAVYAGGAPKRPPLEAEVPKAPDYAQPVYLEGDLARRARSEAASRSMDLNSWVHEILEAELQASEGSIEPRHRSATGRRGALQPIPFTLEAQGADSALSEVAAWLAEIGLLRSVDVPQTAKLRIHQLGPRGTPGRHEPAAALGPLAKEVWVVTDRAGELLSPACPTSAVALEILLRWAQRLQLLELARRRSGPTMDLILKRQTRELLRPTDARWTDGEVTFYEGDELVIEIRNHGDQPLWPYVLDLGVSGAINRLHPDSGTGNPIVPGGSMIIDDLHFELPEDFPFDVPGQRPAGGREALMLLGSSEPIDSDPIFGGKAPAAELQSAALGRILASILSQRMLPAEEDLDDPSWGCVSRSFWLRNNRG